MIDKRFLVRIFAALLSYKFKYLLKGADIKLKTGMNIMNSFEKR